MRQQPNNAWTFNDLQLCFEGGIRMGGVDRVVFCDKPFLKFERLLETYLAFAPRKYSSASTT